MNAKDGSNASKTRILVVEDEGIVAAHIEKTLQEFGFDVVGVASSSEDAIASASTARPDVVLMDIRIQGRLDGIETAEVLHRDFDIPVIYLTAHGDRETVERAKKTEPLAFLIKPFKAQELYSAVQIAVYKHDLERKLRERERWLHTTLQSIANGVITVDGTGIVTFINPAAAALIGATPQEAIGRRIDEVVQLANGDGQPLSATVLKRALCERQAVGVPEKNLLHPLPDAPKPRPVLVSAAPVVENDRVLGAVMVLVDISERVRLHEAEDMAAAERVRTEQAQDALRERDEFIAVASHELRTPLGALSLQLGLLRRLLHARDGESAIEMARNRTDQALKSGRRLEEIIDRLLDVSRIVTGSLDLRLEPLDLSEVVREVSAHFADEASRADCSLRVEAAPAVTGEWDRLRMEQVLANLLSNAVKYARGKRIDVGLEADAERIRLTIRDDGIGISSENLLRVFGRFERAAPVVKYGGLGLGLYITRQIVEAHGGEIDLVSTPGAGSTFTVAMPRHPKLRAAESDPEAAALQAQDTLYAEPGAHGGGRHDSL